MSDTFSNWHEYEIRWTPEEITWLVDGKVGRTQKKADSWNETAQQWDFPQTPARVQLSLWPGGLPSNAPGTIAWAGGEIDWSHIDVKKVGYFYAQIGEVSMTCHKSDSAPGTNKNKGYYYTDARGTNDTVVDGDRDTILGSFTATGLDKDAGKSTAKASSTSAQIPGGGNGNPGNAPDEDTSSNSDGSEGSTGGGGGGNKCGVDSFSQSCDDNSADGTGENMGTRTDRTAGASIFAVVVALCGLFLL